MAILPSCPGLTVEVIVNGEALSEYDDPNGSSEENRAIKYVEAQANSEFKIRYSFTEAFPNTCDISVHFWIDGKLKERSCTRKVKLVGDHHITKIIKKLGSEWVSQTLRFNDIEIVEDPNLVSREDGLQQKQSLGELELKFRFGKIGPKRKHNPRSFELEEQIRIHESDLKGDAKSLYVGSGAQEITKERSIYRWTSQKGPEEVFAVFCFKYRSRANLQALQIIPHDRPSTPVAETSRTDLSSDSRPKIQTPGPEKGSVQNAIKSERFNPISNVRPSPTQQLQNSSSSSANISDHAPRIVSGAGSVLTNSNAQAVLTVEDLTVLIKHYRGSDYGLQSLPEADLMVLLGHYRNKGALEPNVKREPPESGSLRTHIKREADAEHDDRGKVKRGKKEFIVLDD